MFSTTVPGPLFERLGASHGFAYVVTGSGVPDFEPRDTPGPTVLVSPAPLGRRSAAPSLLGADRALTVPVVYPVRPMPNNGAPACNGARRTLEEHAALFAAVPVMGLTATAEASADGPWSSRADQEETCP